MIEKAAKKNDKKKQLILMIKKKKKNLSINFTDDKVHQEEKQVSGHMLTGNEIHDRWRISSLGRPICS